MTMGLFLGLALLGVAFAAMALKRRDPFWAVACVFVVARPALLAWQGAIDPTRFASGPDNLLVVTALAIGGATFLAFEGLPQAVALHLWPELRAWDFDRRLAAARQPFIEAVRNDDPRVQEKARWQRSLPDEAPTATWGALRDRLAAADEELAKLRWAGTPIEAWLAADQQTAAAWESLRARYQQQGRLRYRLERAALGVAAVLFIAGTLHIPTGLSSAPPAGRAPVVPSAPPGRTAYLVPLDHLSTQTLSELATFYAERYGITVEIPLPASFGGALDQQRGQVVGEKLIEGLRGAFDAARDVNSVVIGVTDDDMYLTSVPEWAWAFGLREGGHLGVVSTARMGSIGPFSDRIEKARLRKLITKYLGIMYFGLEESNDPRSVLYSRIVGPDDLDGMGEDY